MILTELLLKGEKKRKELNKSGSKESPENSQKISGARVSG